MNFKARAATLSSFDEKHGHVVVPVYRSPDGDGVVHVGSAILVKTTGKYWLFTAYHVYEDCQGIVLASQPNIRLAGPIVFHTDPVDLAYTEIASADVAAILAAEMAFLPSDMIAPTLDSLAPECCAFTGYPNKAVDLDGDERPALVWPQRIFSTFVDDSVVAAAGYDPAIHLGAPVKIIQRQNEAFDPHGLSGGAIWRVRENGEVKLVGIATEYHRRHGLLIGTRVRPLIENIIKRLAAALEHPKGAS
jgi:hypothetical protein